MSTTPEEHFLKSMRMDFDMLYQQKESRLFKTVRVEPQNALSDEYKFIGLLDDDDDETAVRHADTVWTEVPHSTRWATLVAKDKAVPLDKNDKKMMGPYDPTNGYVQSITGYFGRYIDRKILRGIAGTVKTGIDAGTTVHSYDTGECRLIQSNGDVVAAGGNFTNQTATGLTTLKLQTIQALMTNAGVPDDGRRWLAIDIYTLETMLKDTTYGAEEIKALRDIRSGKMAGLFGLNFVILPQSQFVVNGTDTECYETAAWHQDAVLLATGDGGYSPEIRIDERPDKKYTKQIFANMYSAAIRLHGPGVVRILLPTLSKVA